MSNLETAVRLTTSSVWFAREANRLSDEGQINWSQYQWLLASKEAMKAHLLLVSLASASPVVDAEDEIDRAYMWVSALNQVIETRLLGA
jgi:hypothetical protein